MGRLEIAMVAFSLSWRLFAAGRATVQRPRFAEVVVSGGCSAISCGKSWSCLKGRAQRLLLLTDFALVKVIGCGYMAASVS
jgi:hypothetical protein